MARLTKRTVDAAKAEDRERFVWDGALPGFGLRVLPSGRKTYFVQYRVKGRTRRIALGPYGVLTPDQARTKAIEVLGEVRNGGDPSEDRQRDLGAPSVAALAERYLTDYAEPNKKPRSVAEDRRLIENFVLPQIGNRKVSDIAWGDVLNLHGSLKNTPVQANRVLAVVSRMFTLADRWGMRTDGSNPARRVRPYTENRRERYLTEDELSRLGKALIDAEAQGNALFQATAAIRLLLFTGCRVGEILGLQWTDVDLKERRVRIRDSKTGPRALRLNPPTLEVLNSLRGLHPDWVIPGRNGDKPLVNLSKPWRRIRAAAKIKDLRLHDLRHSFATTGVGAGLSLPVIAKLLGHRRLSTAERYAHVQDRPVRDASNKIARRLSKAMNRPPTDESTQTTTNR